MGWSEKATRGFWALRRERKLTNPEGAAERLAAWIEDHLPDFEASVVAEKGRPKLFLASETLLAVVDVDDSDGAITTDYYAPKGGRYEERFEETDAGFRLTVTYKSEPPRPIRIRETFRGADIDGEHANELRRILRKWVQGPSNVPAASVPLLLDPPSERQRPGEPPEAFAQTFRAEPSSGSSTH